MTEGRRLISENTVLCVFRLEPNIHNRGKTQVTATNIRKTWMKAPLSFWKMEYLFIFICSFLRGQATGIRHQKEKIFLVFTVT